MINIKNMIDMQVELDKTIFEKFNLNYESTMVERKLALIVELAELANEIRSFKYWSIKPSSDFETIIEEFSDCIHFALSFKIALGDDKYEFDIPNVDESINALFEKLFMLVSNYQFDDKINDIIELLFVIAGKLPGISAEKIVEAYNAKNKKNFERQENDY